jgi:hypothetical protein
MRSSVLFTFVIGMFTQAEEVSANGSGQSQRPHQSSLVRRQFNLTSLFSGNSYKEPYVDKDEWKDQPLRHRYVHGGFKGSDLLFSFYFPTKELYQGRFFQGLPGVPGNEQVMLEDVTLGGMIEDVVAFSFESGGYVVESNQGSKSMLGTANPAQANASAATFSRELAKEMYGPHRPYGYVFGGSGRGYKTISCMETTDVWDGAAPFIIGSPASIPNVFTVQGHAMRILEHKFDQIIDNIEPDGSGDMYKGLNTEERQALAEVTKMGFPPPAWFRHKKIALGYTGVFASLLDIVRTMDSKYFTDFWKVPGYLGEQPPESLRSAKINHKTKITKIIKTNEALQKGLPISISGQRGGGRDEVPAAFTFDGLPKGNLQGATISFDSGAGSGSSVFISGVLQNDIALIGFGALGQGAINKVNVGDTVTLDNSIYLASQTYHRHQDPGPEYPVWDQFKTQGVHIYPQRSIEMSKMPLSGSGSVQSGKYKGKIIVIEALYDEAAYPWQADWYRKQVQKHFGPNTDDHFRVWMVDKCMHTSPQRPDEKAPRPAERTRIVSYTPIIQQALRDLVSWAERGVKPPSNTNYTGHDGQVLIPRAAAERQGIQPVVTLKVHGKDRADISVGQSVEFEGTVSVPPSTGSIVATRFDFEGDGTFPTQAEFTKTGDHSVGVKTTYTFTKVGVYFPALLGVAQRNVTSKFGKVSNLGRVRVVVS